MRRVIPFLRRALYRGAPPSILGRRRQRRGVERGIRIRFLPAGFRACRRRANASLGRWSLVDARMRSGVASPRLWTLGQCQRTRRLHALEHVPTGADVLELGTKSLVLVQAETHAAKRILIREARPWTQIRILSHVRREIQSTFVRGVVYVLLRMDTRTLTTIVQILVIGHVVVNFTDSECDIREVAMLKTREDERLERESAIAYRLSWAASFGMIVIAILARCCEV